MVKIFTESDPEKLENELNKWLGEEADKSKKFIGLLCGERVEIPICMKRSISRIHTHNGNLIVFYEFKPK